MHRPGRHRRSMSPSLADSFGGQGPGHGAAPIHVAPGETVHGWWRRHWIVTPGHLVLLAMVLGIDYGLYLAGRIAHDRGLSVSVAVVTPVGLLLLGYHWLGYRSGRFVVTAQRLIVIGGRTGAVRGCIRLDDIEAVHFGQSRMGWRYRYGTVCLRGGGGRSFAMREIAGAEQLFLTILRQVYGDAAAAANGRALVEQQDRFRRMPVYPRSIWIGCHEPWHRRPDRNPWAAARQPATATRPEVGGRQPEPADDFDVEFRASGLCACPDCRPSP